MSLTANDLDELRRLGDSKRVVVVVLKWRYPFFTKLENFRKVEDAGLVGIFAEQIRPKLFHGYEQHFDRTLWFKVSPPLFKRHFFRELETVAVFLHCPEILLRVTIKKFSSGACEKSVLSDYLSGRLFRIRRRLSRLKHYRGT